MGQITAILDSISGSEPDKVAQKESLKILLLAAKGKVAQYKAELDTKLANPDTISKTEVPGGRGIANHTEYHVASSKSFNTSVQSHIEGILDSFFSIGDEDHEGKTGTKEAVKGGVKGLLNAAMEGFIGSTSAGETEQKSYIIVPEHNALVKVDIMCWRYNFDQFKFMEKHDIAVAYVLNKSIVNHKDLTVDELIYYATTAMVTNHIAELTENPFESISGSNEEELESNIRELLPQSQTKLFNEQLLSIKEKFAKNSDKNKPKSPDAKLMNQIKEIGAQLYATSRTGRVRVPSIEKTGEYLDKYRKVWAGLEKEISS